MLAVLLGGATVDAEGTENVAGGDPTMIGSKLDTTRAGTPPDVKAAKTEELNAAALREGEIEIELSTRALLTSIKAVPVADAATSVEVALENVTPLFVSVAVEGSDGTTVERYLTASVEVDASATELPDDGDSVSRDSDELMLRLGSRLVEIDGAGPNIDNNKGGTVLLDDDGAPCTPEEVVVGLVMDGEES